MGNLTGRHISVRMYFVNRGILCDSFVDLDGLHWTMNGLERALDRRPFKIVVANTKHTARQVMWEHCPLGQAHGLLV